MKLAKLFISYSHKDEELEQQLLAHLAPLEHEGLIEAWHDRELEAGDNFNAEISQALDQAQIILFLVSSDFPTSDYINKVEIKRALERSSTGQARVMTIILRACDWRHEPFGPLLAAPTDGKPITLWPDRDVAYLDVVTKVRVALQSPSNALADLKGLGDALDTAAGSIGASVAQLAQLEGRTDLKARANSVRADLIDMDAKLKQLVFGDQDILTDNIRSYVELAKRENASPDELSKSWNAIISQIRELIEATTRILDRIKANRSDFVLEDAYQALLSNINMKIGLLGRTYCAIPSASR